MGMQEYLLEKAKTTGLNLGLQKGMEEERARAEAEKLESARKFKAMGMCLEDIAKGLDLSIDDIEKL